MSFKCDNCGRDATVHLTEINFGKKIERHLCDQCRAQMLGVPLESNAARRLINLVLLQAIKDKASEIRFEPSENEFSMRYCIDGVLQEMMPPPARLGPAIISRLKEMAGLDVAERGKAQEGQVEVSVNNQSINLQVSVWPTAFGENAVMRVMS